MSFIVVAILGATIYLFAAEMLYFSNTFGINNLLFRGGALGGILGGIFAYFFSKGDEMDSVDLMKTYIGCIITGAIIFVPLSSWSNHAFAGSGKRDVPVVFIEERGSMAKQFGVVKGQESEATMYYTDIMKDNKLARLRSTTSMFKGVAAGTKVQLPLKKGFWGYDFFEL
jgi:hypothetical protein